MQPFEKEFFIEELRKLFAYDQSPISQKDFPRSVLSFVDQFVRRYRSHTVIQKAVMKNPDFVPRAYVVCALRHAAFGHPPMVNGMVRDLVDCLDKNHAKKIEETMEYWRSSHVRAFFPQLLNLWEGIDSLYAVLDQSDRGSYPPTKYHAFVLVSLNDTDELIFSSNKLLSELSERLQYRHEKMSSVIAMMEQSQIKPKDVH